MQILTLWMRVCVLHDFGELLIHPLHQGQDAATNTERLEYTMDKHLLHKQNTALKAYRSVHMESAWSSSGRFDIIWTSFADLVRDRQVLAILSDVLANEDVAVLKKDV